MPFCPECRAEYRAGIAKCAACEVPLVSEDELPELLSDDEIIGALSEDELVPAFEGPLQALRPLQEKLLAAGIPAAMRQGEELTTEHGLFIKLELVVRKSDIDRVAEVLGEENRKALEREGLSVHVVPLRSPEAEEEDEAGEESLACPACGCTEPLVEGECPECGLFLG